ncbi:hypothetical protein K492DRAFT_130374, partial [Lichtheimia hyalospora FSU 10163]
QYPKFKDIIVDQLPQQHKVQIFSREQLLNDDDTLGLFYIQPRRLAETVLCM